VWYGTGKDEGHGFPKKTNRDFRFYGTVKLLKEYLLKRGALLPVRQLCCLTTLGLVIMSSQRISVRVSRSLGKRLKNRSIWIEILSRALLDAPRKTTVRTLLASSYSGMLPCFLRGFVSRLFSRARSAVITRVRVSAGSITASM
jgi:hypothetical protein